jgi:hypothetical protein
MCINISTYNFKFFHLINVMTIAKKFQKKSGLKCFCELLISRFFKYQFWNSSRRSKSLNKICIIILYRIKLTGIYIQHFILFLFNGEKYIDFRMPDCQRSMASSFSAQIKESKICKIRFVFALKKWKLDRTLQGWIHFFLSKFPWYLIQINEKIMIN